MVDAYDYEGLPHPQIRQLVDRLERGETGHNIDSAVIAALKAGGSGALSPNTDIFHAIKLIPEQWWWHVSHLGAEIIPTTPAPGLESVLSNATRHGPDGRPIRYNAMAHYDRQALPRAVCAAMLKAVYDLPAAFAVRASTSSHESDEVIEARQKRVAEWRQRGHAEASL